MANALSADGAAADAGAEQLTETSPLKRRGTATDDVQPLACTDASLSPPPAQRLRLADSAPDPEEEAASSPVRADAAAPNTLAPQPDADDMQDGGYAQETSAAPGAEAASGAKTAKDAADAPAALQQAAGAAGGAARGSPRRALTVDVTCAAAAGADALASPPRTAAARAEQAIAECVRSFFTPVKRRPPSALPPGSAPREESAGTPAEQGTAASARASPHLSEAACDADGAGAAAHDAGT